MSNRGRHLGKTAGAVGLAVIALVLGNSHVAIADGGVNSDALQMLALPPSGASGISAAAYAALFAGNPADSPTGTIVATRAFGLSPTASDS